MKLKTKVKTAKTRDEHKNKILLSILKGSLTALCISLVGILMFAFLLKFTNISDSVIRPVNQVIKGVSVLLGVFIGLKKEKDMGLVSGLLIGIIYTMVAFLVFSILDGNFAFNRTLLNDVIFGGLMGAICGIICVNIKKSSV